MFTHLSVGGGGMGGGGVNNGNVYVRLLRSASVAVSFDIQQDLRTKLRTLPNVRPTIQGQMSIFGGRGQPIKINVQGPEVSRLKIAAANVLEAVRRRTGRGRAQLERRGPDSAARRARRPPGSVARGTEHQSIGATLSAAVCRPARHALGRSAGLRARRDGDVPRLDADLGGRRREHRHPEHDVTPGTGRRR